MNKKIDLRRICKPGIFSNPSSNSSDIKSHQTVTSTEILLHQNRSESATDQRQQDEVSFKTPRSKSSSKHSLATSSNRSLTSEGASIGGIQQKKLQSRSSKHDVLAERLSRYHKVEATLREQVDKVISNLINRVFIIFQLIYSVRTSVFCLLLSSL